MRTKNVKGAADLSAKRVADRLARRFKQMEAGVSLLEAKYAPNAATLYVDCADEHPDDVASVCEDLLGLRYDDESFFEDESGFFVAYGNGTHAVTCTEDADCAARYSVDDPRFGLRVLRVSVFRV